MTTCFSRYKSGIQRRFWIPLFRCSTGQAALGSGRKFPRRALDKAGRWGIIDAEGRRRLRYSPTKFGLHGNRHRAGWRFPRFFTMIVTVNGPTCNVIRMASPPSGGVAVPPTVYGSASSAQTPTNGLGCFMIQQPSPVWQEGSTSFSGISGVQRHSGSRLRF